MTTASKVTMLRIILVPLMVLIYGLHFPSWNIACAIVFILASMTDAVDGYIARKYDQVTNFGKLVDPIADKLLTNTALFILVAWGKIPSYVAMVIFLRDIIINAYRVSAAENGLVIAARNSGKIKTVLQIIAFTAYLFGVDIVGLIFIIPAVLMTVYSLYDYINANLHIFKKVGTRAFLWSFADKIITNFLMLYLSAVGKLPVWVATLIIFRDLFINGFRVNIAAMGSIMPVRISSLVKGGMQMVLFVCMLFWSGWWVTVLMWVVIAITILSFLDYAVVFRRQIGLIFRS